MRLPLCLACAALSLARLVHAADGAEVFRANCAACHQPDARGVSGVAPALIGPHWDLLRDSTNGYLLKVLTSGLTGKITVNGDMVNGVMPSFAQLDSEELAAVANYVLSLNAPAATPATAAHVTAGAVQAARESVLKPAQVNALRRRLLKE